MMRLLPTEGSSAATRHRTAKDAFLFGVSEGSFLALTVGSGVKSPVRGCTVTPSRRRRAHGVEVDATMRFHAVGSCLAVPPPGVERDPPRC